MTPPRFTRLKILKNSNRNCNRNSLRDRGVLRQAGVGLRKTRIAELAPALIALGTQRGMVKFDLGKTPVR